MPPSPALWVLLLSAILVLMPGCVTPGLLQDAGCDPKERLRGSVAMVLCNQTGETFVTVIEYGYEDAYWQRDIGNYSESIHGRIVTVSLELGSDVHLIVPETWKEGKYMGRIAGTHASTGEEVVATIKFETDSCRGFQTGTDLFVFHERDGGNRSFGLRHSGACV